MRRGIVESEDEKILSHYCRSPSADGRRICITEERWLRRLTKRLRCLLVTVSIRSDLGNRIRLPAVGDGKVP